MTTHVVSPIEFDGRDIEVSGQAFHHLFRVKRLRVGEEMRVVDGEGRARRGVVARVERSHGVVALGGALASLEPGLRLALLVALPKPDRAAWLVEKSTELGAHSVHFVLTERSARDERALGAPQLLRLHRVAVAAVEQCGRSQVPQVSGLHPLAEAVARERAAGARVLGLDARAELGLAAADLEEGRPVAVLVGPEGGWSEAERAELDGSRTDWRSLGERVLRVETAAVAACAVLLAAPQRRALR